MIINDSFELQTENVYQITKFKGTTFIPCRNMFRWLYNTGILKKTAFLFQEKVDEKGNICVYYALDTKDLEPYQKRMLNSGVDGCELACGKIFGDEISPGRYSGAVTLNYSMNIYRNNNGTISRSWESSDEQELEHDILNVIYEIRKKYGVKEAVKSLWDILTEDLRLSSEINITNENPKNYELPGAAFAWFKNEDGTQTIGVEYQYSVTEETNSSAIYLMQYDAVEENMITDTDNFVHYEIDFSADDWEYKLKTEMYLLLLQYIYDIQEKWTLQCPKEKMPIKKLWLVSYMVDYTQFIVNEDTMDLALQAAINANIKLGEVENTDSSNISDYIVEEIDFSLLTELMKRSDFCGKTEDTIILEG